MPTPGVVVPRIDFAGHSIPGAGGSVGGDQNAYPDRLAKALGARRRANLANGGSVSCWPSANASGDGGWSWVLNNFQPPAASDGGGGYPPHTTLAVVHGALNDLAALGAASYGPALQALRTICSRYCAAALYEDTDASWTHGSAMSALTSNWTYSGGNAHYCQWGGSLNANQFSTWTVPSDYPGNLVCAIGLAAVPGTLGAGSTITVAITVDGTEYDLTLSCDKGGVADAETGKTNGIVLRLGRADCGLGLPVSQGGLGIPALGPGPHTIKVALKSSTTVGAYFVVDYAQIEADPLDGPALVVPGNHRAASPTNQGYNLWATWAHGPAAATDPMNDASVASANAQLRAALAADFPGRSLFVDIDAVLGKNPAYLSPSDYTHPTNRGHALIATAIAQAVINSELLTQRVRAATDSQRFQGPFDGGLWRPIGGAFGTSIGVPLANTWGAYGAPFLTPCYRKALDGHVFKRGTVKQTGAGAANSVLVALANAVGYKIGAVRDRTAVVYTGSAYATGQLRQDPVNGTFLAGSGQVAASSFNKIDDDWWAEG